MQELRCQITNECPNLSLLLKTMCYYIKRWRFPCHLDAQPGHRPVTLSTSGFVSVEVPQRSGSFLSALSQQNYQPRRESWNGNDERFLTGSTFQEKRSAPPNCGYLGQRRKQEADSSWFPRGNGEAKIPLVPVKRLNDIEPRNPRQSHFNRSSPRFVLGNPEYATRDTPCCLFSAFSGTLALISNNGMSRNELTPCTRFIFNVAGCKLLFISREMNESNLQ